MLRPSNPHTASVHSYLQALHDAGFDGVPRPVGVDPDGRERLVFIPGEVAVPPFPGWFQTDAALASVTRLLRRFHDASAIVGPGRGPWSSEMADPAGGSIVVHNDVCPENVVFRDGEAVALLDFDFAAPGRPVHDLAAMARMCGPVDDEVSAARVGWGTVDQPHRLAVVADSYGLDATGRADLLGVLDEMVARGGEWMQGRVAAGDTNFVEAWTAMGGMARYDRRRRWWVGARPDFVLALR